MKTTSRIILPPETRYAAENAREGLINVSELSRLVDVEVALLNKYSKAGQINHYGEYHGKRFYRFQEIVNWLVGSEGNTEAKTILSAKLQQKLSRKDCPYSLEKSDGEENVRITWKEFL